MKLEDIKKGMIVIEKIGNNEVRIVKIKITKHYGPRRPVCVRFSNGHSEYYSAEDLEKIITEKTLKNRDTIKLCVQGNRETKPKAYKENRTRIQNTKPFSK